MNDVPGTLPPAAVHRRLIVALMALLMLVTMMTSPSGATGNEVAATTTPEGVTTAGEEPVTTSAFEGLDARRYEITLITGDVVTLHAGATGDYHLEVDMALRADGSTPPVDATVDEDNGVVRVVPSDAHEFVSAGVLDPLLFDVTYLAANGYADADRAVLPLIAEKEAGPSSAGVSEMPAATQRTELRSLSASVLDVDKDQVSGFWDAWHAAASAAGADDVTAGSLWLDQAMSVELDESVDQVGAPFAWDLGLDGSGTTVAVIDTGYDPEHPDLQDRVVDSQSFVPDEDVVDGHGHGTHVASIVAGAGEQYAGIARGTDLVIGKGLSDNGSGDMSHIIEAIEWAVLDVGADIVNLSLGGDPTDGTDPASQVINDLTEQEGVLFVVSAGNDGAGAFTVTTPATADAALSIASVDRSDVIASTSSRGPREGDHALKPELSAPGVDIAAARADGTSLGTPIDDYYTRASGTSMAAPHVAGAAAILLEADADLSADELKSTLVTTSDPVGDDVYAYGAGRLDLPSALTNDVTVSPATADFGFFEWPPSGEPTTRELTYTNSGEDDLTLSLTAEIATTGDGPPPQGALELDNDEIVVAPGSDATVTATLDHTVLDAGFHTGFVQASGPDDLRLVTPVGASVEEEQFTVGLDIVERADVDTFEIITAQIFGVDGAMAGESNAINCLTSCPDNRAEFDVPDGVYNTLTWVRWYGPDSERHFGVISDPEVVVTEDTDVVLDANTVRQMTFETPRPSEAITAGSFSVGRTTADGSNRHISVLGSSDSIDWWISPTEPITRGNFFTASPWLLGSPDADGSTPEYVYSLKAYEDEAIRDDPHYVFNETDLASIDHLIHANERDTPFQMSWSHRRPDEFASGTVNMQFEGAETLREYTGPVSSESQHMRRLNHVSQEGSFPTAEATDRFAEAGQHTIEWNTRPVVPGAIERPYSVDEFPPSFPDSVCVGCRQDDSFYPFVHHTTAEPNHTSGTAGVPSSDAEMVLLADGAQIEPSAPYIGAFTTYDLPPEAGEYVLSHSELGVDTTWEFTSSTVTEDASPHGVLCPPSLIQGSEAPCRAEPLIFLRYAPELDLDNTAPSPGRHRLNIDVYHVADDAPAIAHVQLRYSTDGETWTEVDDLEEVEPGTFRADIDTTDSNATVSLHAEASDVDGNRVEQTVQDAYGLHEREEPELVGVEVDPASAELAPGDEQQFTALAIYDDDEEPVEVTADAQWASSDQAVLTIEDGGVATAVAEGTANITATYEGETGSATVIVSDEQAPGGPVALEVTPPETSVGVGGVAQLSATAIYEDDSEVDVTADTDWASADDNIAAVDDGGLVTGVTEGTVDVTAEFDGLSDNATITVVTEIEPAPGGLERISAPPGRIEVAIAASQHRFDDGEASAVVLARADEYPDALAGTTLAAEHDAPLLITSGDDLVDNVADEISRVLGENGTVYLAGGTEALDDTVQYALDDLGYDPVRLGGRTRFETAGLIADELGERDQVLVTTGLDFPDALTAGAAAAANGGVVLLSAGDDPHDVVDAYLDAFDGEQVWAIGGPATRAYPDADGVMGQTRDETAVAVADALFDQPVAFGVARRDDYPDALAGGAHIAVYGGPLLLSYTDEVPEETAGWLVDTDATGGFVYGGTEAISEAAFGELEDLVFDNDNDD